MAVSKRGLGSITILGVGVGLVLGIILAHVFKGPIDSVYSKIPVLNTLGSHYAAQYY